MRDLSMLDDDQIVAIGLRLARRFYKEHGYDVPEGFKFYESRHPQELAMWNMACIAMDELTGTDLEDCVSNLGE